MKQELSNKKILVYTISLYILLLISEFSFNILAFISNYSTGKVGTSFFSKASDIISLLKFDVILYILILICVYLTFSLINTTYVLLVYQELSQRKSNLPLSTKAYLFISINFFFILS